MKNNESDWSSYFVTIPKSTNYDLLIIDYFFEDETFNSSEINQLRLKQNGGKRLLIAYLSIREAEDYRYYWNSDWKEILYGNDSSYLKK